MTLSTESIPSLAKLFGNTLLSSIVSDEQLETLEQQLDPANRFRQYLDDPVGFSHDVLGIYLVPCQRPTLESLLEPSNRTLATAVKQRVDLSVIPKIPPAA